MSESDEASAIDHTSNNTKPNNTKPNNTKPDKNKPARNIADYSLTDTNTVQANTVQAKTVQAKTVQANTVQANTGNQKELARTFYQAGKAAFESGQYRQAASLLEKAIALVPKTSILSGEAKIWLVMAQDAGSNHDDAITLCTQLTQHPHLETAQQAKRLLYILKAPKLQTRPEWKTEIPDLSRMEEGDRIPSKLANYPRKPQKKKPQTDPLELDPIDWSQIDTKDNQFIVIALGVMMMILGLWGWLGA